MTYIAWYILAAILAALAGAYALFGFDGVIVVLGALCAALCAAYLWLRSLAEEG